MSAKYFLINNNPPHSGVGRYAYSLFKALYTVLKGEVQFVSWDRQLFDRSYNTLSYFHLNWLYYVLKLRLLSRRLSLKDVSLVHVANAGYLASIIPSIKKRNRRVVLTVHDVIPENLRDSFSHRMAGKAITNASLADYIVCVSENVRKNLPTVLGANLERITTVHYGVDHSLFKPRDKTWARRKLNLPTNMPIILNVGSEEPRKNIPILIKAFYEIIKDIPNAILVRVGPRTARVSKIITALGLDGRIYYRRASDREVALYYNAADLFSSSCIS
ncbi:MAG: glycosyltransferase [Candidatus Bathyarchaeia archaeon]